MGEIQETAERKNVIRRFHITFSDSSAHIALDAERPADNPAR
jgi:hypothetical protein